MTERNPTNRLDLDDLAELVAALLAASVEPASPRPELRERILATIAGRSSHAA